MGHGIRVSVVVPQYMKICMADKGSLNCLVADFLISEGSEFVSAKLIRYIHPES